MADTDELLGSAGQTEPSAPRPKAPPIESRFLFVDVAAMRAKQLRRGALPRPEGADGEAAERVGHRAPPPPPSERRCVSGAGAGMAARRLRRGALPRLEGADEEEAERVVHRTHPF